MQITDCKISKRVQKKLLEFFVLQVTARIAASPFAAALSQPMGQTVEIVNQCPHDIAIRAKGLFNPWRKVFNRRTLEAGGRIQETQIFCSLFSCTIKPLPNWTFSGGGQGELPYEAVPLRNRPSPGHTQVVVCPE